MGLYDELEGFDWRTASEVGSRPSLCSAALSKQGYDWSVASQTSSRPGACVVSTLVHCLQELCPARRPLADVQSTGDTSSLCMLGS